MPETLSIVSMQPGHIESLAAIEKLCFSDPWSAQSLMEELEYPPAVYRVAELDGKPVGYAGMRVAGGIGYIDNVAVHPDYRHLGAATGLLREFDQFAREHRLESLTLEVRVSNTPAIRLYSREGFQSVGIRPGFYSNPREDAMIMTKVYG